MPERKGCADACGAASRRPAGWCGASRRPARAGRRRHARAVGSALGSAVGSASGHIASWAHERAGGGGCGRAPRPLGPSAARSGTWIWTASPCPRRPLAGRGSAAPGSRGSGDRSGVSPAGPDRAATPPGRAARPAPAAPPVLPVLRGRRGTPRTATRGRA
ncbi:hypothetical protein B9W62_09665 [Streptomyces sp. CS113]|nr:hypothetical protein B9W62_09665 [Streptomyces sp. CS113]